MSIYENYTMGSRIHFENHTFVQLLCELSWIPQGHCGWTREARS